MTDNGLRVLLLTISGVLPILFNQQQYNIPIQIWFPLTYPVEPPFIFVTPTAQMIIKPNRSVDLSGRVMLPYITYWNQNNNMLECLAKMREVFSVEPPVMAKPTNNHAVNQTSPVSSRPNSMHLQNHPVARPQNQSVAPPIPKFAILFCLF
ncbi:UEV domain-containing protein [Globomyces pollinis-pini]|nr:UEV domain-containing protein [Globomyces pollinis-pini]